VSGLRFSRFGGETQYLNGPRMNGTRKYAGEWTVRRENERSCPKRSVDPFRLPPTP